VRLLHAAIAAAAILAASPALAQPTAAPLARGDASGLIGWLNVDRSGEDDSPYDEWANRIAFAGGSFGWYWTDHLKTEIDAGVSTVADRYATIEVHENGFEGYTFSEQTFSSRHLAVSQRYQFFRNAFFHPSVGIGVDVVWRTMDRHDEETIVYDRVTGRSRVLLPARDFPRATTTEARPFAEAGFKTYFNRRAFFRTDMRLTFRDGLDEVLFRFGFGADF
jgi:hypothetical protein